MIIKIKKLKENAIIPNIAHKGDVGMDLFATENHTIMPNEHYIAWHGIAIEFPEDFAIIVKDKGSISKAGIHTMGGVYDAGYRGEYNTHLVNLSGKPFEIKIGDKLSQIVMFPVCIPEIIETNELSETERGEGRFGSTGKNIND